MSILGCIAIFFIGVIVGFTLMALVSVSRFEEDDFYDTGRQEDLV